MYSDALDGLQKDSKSFFDWFEKEDKTQLEKLENGDITEKQYKEWRLEQVRKSDRFKAMQEKLADRMLKANQIALAYANNDMAAIYALNRNFAEFEVEKIFGNVNFTLWDESTVKRLIVEEPDLLPDYPEELAVDRGIDLKYNQEQVRQTVTSGILRGKAIPDIASELMARLPEINRNSAVRAARTAITSAQNAGRQDTYKAAADMGIKVRKRWIATKDGRTRHAHQKLDGQIVDWDKAFSSELGKIMYPGDRTAKPGNIYNCRCTMRTVEKPGIEVEPRQMRVRDPKTGKNVLVNEMTYEEWEEWVKNR